MQQTTLEAVYSEILKLREDIKELRSLIIPEIEISNEEKSEILSIARDMENGEETEWRKIQS